jgi:hypothetical protein
MSGCLPSDQCRQRIYKLISSVGAVSGWMSHRCVACLWQTASLLAFEPAALKSKEHMMDNSIFTGCMPALMTPCKADRTPDFDALVRKGKELIAAGMSAVVYCGSMGDWPLLTDAQRMEGVERLVRRAFRWWSARARSTVPWPRHMRRTRQSRRKRPDGDSAGAVARQLGERTIGPFPGDPVGGTRASGGDLQQPLLRVRHPRRSVLRAAQGSSEPGRLQGVRRCGGPALRGREHHLARTTASR